MSEHIMGQADKISEKPPDIAEAGKALMDAVRAVAAAKAEGYAAGLAAGEKERKELVEAIVELAIPYEALLLDDASRWYIVPAIWNAIDQGVKIVRALLSRQATAIEEEKEK